MPNKYTMGANGLELVIEGGGGSSVTLYDTTGQNTDGAMTQKATTDALNDKVDKETGKGLSTNDFTTADKDKLEDIEDDAQKNVQSDWAETDNTKDDFIKNKPTKVSDFTNDSNYQTDTEVATAINNKLTTVMDYKGSVATYDDLPTTDVKTGDVYNVVDTGNNYAWDGTAWDKLGDTVDLSGYYTSTEVDDLLDNKLDKVNTTGDELLYGVDNQGVQKMVRSHVANDPWTVAYRNGNGVFSTGTPTADAHVANKKYVDSKHVALTQAEYNALSDDEKMSDRVYMITDGDRPNVSLELPAGIPGVATAYTTVTGDPSIDPPAVYSPHGYSYTWDGGNGGTSTKIIGGGSHVTCFRTSWATKYTAGQSGSIGIHNIKGSLYSTWWGIKGGAVVNPETHSYTASSTGYAGAISGTAGVTGVRITYQGVKDPDGESWLISGDYITTGASNYLHFLIRCTAANPDFIPTLYQRGATTANTSAFSLSMEMDEI